MPEHEVKEGDCMATIAVEHKFYRWESIYYHEKNAKLREDRPSPDQLKKGDKVFIPELEDREEICETGQTHLFQLREEPTVEVSAALEVDGRLLGNMKFELKYTTEGAEKTQQGYTTPEGEVERRVPLDVTQVELKVWPSESEDPYTWNLKVGDLDPVSEDSGAQDRLRNLGYDLGDEDGEIGEKTEAALKAFQELAGIKVTGTLDEATQEALDERANA